MTNQEIAEVQERVADLLEAQDASRYRVQAYRRAAAPIAGHPEPLVQLLEKGGVDAVDALPTIGPTIAAQPTARCAPRAARCPASRPRAGA